MDYRLEQLRFELREDPTSRIFFKLGEHLRREGELDEAIDVLQNGLKQHPRYVAAWVSLGRALHDFGDAAGAVNAFLHALELDPENGVAARSAGEAAIANGDWIEAVKNLKRARGIMPQDDALDERIAFVEERLDELGMLEVKAAAPPVETVPNPVMTKDPSEEEVFVVEDGASDTESDGGDDVFETDWDGENADEPEVIFEHDEVIDDTPVGDAELQIADPPQPAMDVDFEIVDEKSEEASPFDTSSIAVDEPIAEIVEVEEVAEDTDVEFVQPEPEILPNLHEDSEPVSEPEIFVEPAIESEPEPVFEFEAQNAVEVDDPPQPDAGDHFEQTAEDVPLPTVTLARLAMEQGDFALAERTARAVLEREPDQPEAMALLETFAARNEAGNGPDADADGADERTRALQRWLEAVRLAAEKLES